MCPEPKDDPLDTILKTGYRVVWMEDFDYRITLVDEVRVLLIDHRVERCYAASEVRDLLAESDSLRELPDAS